MRYLGVIQKLILLLMVLPLPVKAEKFCLLLAENYYEQLYCEVKAMGHGDRLPSLVDFRRNNEMTQAFLLKRPAAKLGIQLAKPKRNNSPKSPESLSRPRNIQATATIQAIPKGTQTIPKEKSQQKAQVKDVGSYFQNCSLQAEQIHCHEGNYQLVGNLSNKKLKPGVLEKRNRMSIPVFLGSVSNPNELDRYLTVAYQQYLQKMLEIGLGGSTLSYSKFVYFYHDVTAKGIDFSQRFETMFDYLKRDKQRMTVSERLPSTVHLALSGCDRLQGQLVVCQAGRKNYLYRRQH